MNFNQMKQDADSRSQYAKLERDKPTKVKFLSDDFKKIEKTFNGKLNVKYEVPCMIDGQKKLYQGGKNLYEKCMLKAANRGRSFTDITYIITKTGEGLATEYDVDVLDNPLETVDTNSVPF